MRRNWRFETRMQDYQSQDKERVMYKFGMLGESKYMLRLSYTVTGVI